LGGNLAGSCENCVCMKDWRAHDKSKREELHLRPEVDDIIALLLSGLAVTDCGEVECEKAQKPARGVEPPTYGLRNHCSTTELGWRLLIVAR
jgi:hypothetical protein